MLQIRANGRDGKTSLSIKMKKQTNRAVPLTASPRPSEKNKKQLPHPTPSCTLQIGGGLVEDEVISI